MRHRIPHPATLVLLALLSGTLANSALAQSETPPTADAAPIEEEPIDWILTEIPERKATLAVADFNNGLVLATRCVKDLFEVTIHGLPATDSVTRTLQVTMDDMPAYSSDWIVSENKTGAFSRVPVRFARGLAKGGVLQIRVPGARGKPATRYVLDLPPSHSAVEQTLAACGKSLVDLRYDTMEDESGSGLPQGIEWVTRPKPNFPPPTGLTMSTVGYVTVSCGVSAALRPENCLIESEYPAGFSFGRATLRSVEGGQLRLTNPDAPLPPQTTILFNVNFRME